MESSFRLKSILGGLILGGGLIALGLISRNFAEQNFICTVASNLGESTPLSCPFYQLAFESRTWVEAIGWIFAAANGLMLLFYLHEKSLKPLNKPSSSGVESDTREVKKPAVVQSAVAQPAIQGVAKEKDSSMKDWISKIRENRGRVLALVILLIAIPVLLTTIVGGSPGTYSSNVLSAKIPPTTYSGEQNSGALPVAPDTSENSNSSNSTTSSNTNLSSSSSIASNSGNRPTSGLNLIDANNGLNAISCSSTSFCMAADTSGNIFKFENGRWAESDQTGDVLGEVTCLSTSFCATVGYGNEGGDVFMYNGSTWSGPDTIDPGYKLHSISCASASFCIAGAATNVFVYSNRSWSQANPVDPGNTSGVGIPSVSCSTNSFCLAVDAYGNVLMYNSGAWARVSQVDPNTQLNAVSCTSDKFCMAVDDNGAAFSYENGNWSSQIIDQGEEITAVSCTSSMSCFAGDTSGDVFQYSGKGWSSASQVDPGNSVTGISCVPNYDCVLTDDAGNVLTFR